MTKEQEIEDILGVHRLLSEKAKKPWTGLIALSLYNTLQNMNTKDIHKLWLDMNKIVSTIPKIQHVIGIDASCLLQKVEKCYV